MEAISGSGLSASREMAAPAAMMAVRLVVVFMVVGLVDGFTDQQCDHHGRRGNGQPRQGCSCGKEKGAFKDGAHGFGFRMFSGRPRRSCRLMVST